jgi:hypothetical protein
MVFNITHSITIMSDGSVNFRKFPIEGTALTRGPAVVRHVAAGLADASHYAGNHRSESVEIFAK